MVAASLLPVMLTVIVWVATVLPWALVAWTRTVLAPSARWTLLKVKWPLESAVVVPSVNLTVPVGVLVPTPAMVAVNVMDAPELDGFAEEVTVVVVVPCTDCDTEPLLLLKPPVPVKDAVMVCVATASERGSPPS